MKWMEQRRWYYLFSFLVLAIALFPLVLGKLNLSLEFTGGARLVVMTDTPQDVFVPAFNAALDESEKSYDPVKPRGTTEYEVVIESLTNEEKNKLITNTQDRVGQPVQELSFQTIGPTMGRELLIKTGLALILGVASILIYVWWQFQDWRFGLAAVIAMIHDSLFVLGVFSWLGWQFGASVDILFVTAILTTLSFSVHDTIVLFDRVRELQKQQRIVDPLERANKAFSQTLMRSINNSLTILFMLAALILLGGESLRWFAMALFCGTLAGTYSSPFIALSLYVDFSLWKKRSSK